jgi:hypothetical protein
MRLTKPCDSPFIPENPLCENILKLFMDEESSDVAFDVGTEQAETSTATFFVHRLILQESSFTLGELCKSREGPTSIPITDVKPDIFRHLLHYIYGGKISEEDLKANAKDIIDAADKYGVVGLKLEAEASFVTSTTITIDNVMDNLLYADSKNCALLKEAAMDFFADNRNEAIKRVNFDNFPGHLVKDLLTVVARGKEEEESDDNSNASDFSTMRVSALRKKLNENGLEVDGSRETMIVRLEEEMNSE